MIKMATIFRTDYSSMKMVVSKAMGHSNQIKTALLDEVLMAGGFIDSSNVATDGVEDCIDNLINVIKMKQHLP